MLHPALSTRLARLARDQQAAATAPPGPVLCVAPAGSGKTTTLVARIAWLIGSGAADPASVAAITFNTRAAEELEARLADALRPLDVAPGEVRVRTFHALGREILLDAGVPIERIVDRPAVLRVLGVGDPAERRRLDTVISRFKLDLRVRPQDAEADPRASPDASAYATYEHRLRATGGLDFDDLVVRALAELEADPALRERWRARCSHLHVDEVQDVDRSQLDLALLLAAPEHRIFLVGDDDQSIYGWRLADVRRVLSLAERLPGLRRHDLVTNYRCPGPVVERAVRLVSVNRERFAKRIVARHGAVGRLVLAPDPGDDDDRARHVLASWGLARTGRPPDEATRAILARTNRELLPAAAVALDLGIAFRAPRLELPLDDPRLTTLLDAAVAADPDLPLLVALARIRETGRAATRDSAAASPTGDLAAADPMDDAVSDPGPDLPSHAPPGDRDRDPTDDGWTLDELAGAVLSWAAPFRDARSFVAAVRERQAALAALRRDDAALHLATAHGTKGLEFDEVAVIDMDADRFPSRRSLDDAEDRPRALEEERRLAYVAWTRARRSLTLVYDPAAPSVFLAEAFDVDEVAGDG